MLFAQSKLSVSISNPSDVHLCIPSEFLTIEVRNITTSTVSGIETEVELPTGVTYIPGSLGGNLATEKNISNLSKPVFTVSNLGLAQAAQIKIKLNVACGISTFLNNGGLAVVKTTTIYAGGSIAKNSSPLNVKQPSLQIQSISNQFKTVTRVGESFSRQVTLKNSGGGKLARVVLRRKVQAGLTITTAGGATVYQNGDTTITVLDSTDFKSIGNGDIYLDLNESIAVTDIVKVKLCSNLSESFWADWGCNSEKCKITTASANVSISNIGPDLIISSKSSTSNCIDNSSTHPQQIVIFNSGSDTARDVDVHIFQSYTSGLYTYMMSELEPNSFNYQWSKAGSAVNVTPYKTQATVNTGNYSCLSSNPIGGAFLLLPDLPPGDSLIVNFTTRSCLPTTCNNVSFYSQRWKYEVACLDQCAKLIKSGESWGNTGTYHSLIFSKFLPTDILDGQKVRLEYTLSNGYLLNPINSSQLKLELILPNGLSHSKTATDLKFIHANGTSWSPSYFTQNGDTVRAYFNGKPTVTLPRAELQIDVIGNCNGLSSNKTLTYDLKLYYSPDTSCSNYNFFPTYCDQDQLKIHCASSCNAGLHFNGFEAKRINFGQPDNNNDGIADASGNLDFDKVKTNRIMYGDTLLTTFRAKVHNAGSITNWYYGKATSKLDWGYYMSVADVRIKIYRTGNLLFNCNNLIYNYTSSGYAKTFTFDISYNNLINSGCVLYSSFAYLGVDSIELEVKYVVDKNPGNAVRDLNIENDFYLSTVANPNASQKFQCDSFSARLSLIGYYFTNYGKNQITTEGCGDISISQNYYLSVGNCCVNYAGGNIFPYEYRKWAKLHEIILKKPDGFDVVSSSFLQYRTKGTGYTATQSLNPIQANSVSPTQLNYRTDSLYEDLGGNFLISDDGFTGTFTTTLRPNCKAQELSNVIDYGFVFQKYNGLGSGLDTLFAQASADVIDYKSPKVDVLVKNSYVYANSDTVEWDIRLINTSTAAAAEFFWLGAIANSNTSVVQIVDLLTGDTLQRLNDIYKFGELQKLAQRDLRIKVVYQNCDIDSVNLFTGFDCAGYPTNLNSYPCSKKRTRLYFEPINTRLEASINDTSVSVNLCENKVYTIQIRNTGSPKVFDTYLDILVRPGMVLADTAWLYVDGRSDSIYVSAPAYLGSNTYRWSLSSQDSAFNASGLNGVNSTSGYVMTLKFSMTTNCDFTSGSFFLIKPGGYLKCGDAVNAAFTVGDPIDITGVTKPYFSATSLILSHLDVCNYADSSSIKFINLGPDTTGITDKMIISLPLGLMLDTNYIDNGHNAPVGKPKYTLLNGENTYSWRIPSGIGAGDSSVFKFKTIIENAQLSCGVKQVFAQAVISQPVMCVLDSSWCNINVATSSVLKSDSVEKSVYDMQFKSAVSVPDGTNEVVDLNYSLSNSGAHKLYGNELFVDIIYDQNANGVVDSAEIRVARDTILNALLNGQSLDRFLQFSVASEYTCNLLMFISDSNCVCSEVVVSIPAVRLLNAGEDTLACPGMDFTIGTLGSNQNTYSWNNDNLLDRSDSSRVVFTGINNTTATQNIAMVLTTDKGNCSSSDTVIIGVFPAMKVQMADTAKMCKYGKVLIGEVVSGGVGRVKQYQWSPTDSLDYPNNVKTYANPLVNTLYKIQVIDQAGCVLKDSVLVQVIDKPIIDFSITDSCASTNFKFTNTTDYLNTGSDSVHWQIGALFETNFNSPIYKLDSAGIYPVQLYVNNEYGCWDTLTQWLEVFPLPEVGIKSYNDCEQDTTTIVSVSTIAKGNLSYFWEINANQYTDSLILVTVPQLNSLNIKLTATSDKGCIAQAFDTLGIYDRPDVSLNLENECFGDSSYFNLSKNAGTIDSISNYLWELGNGNTESRARFKTQYPDTGVYMVSVIATNANGCSDTATAEINIYALPKSDFTATSVCIGDSVEILDHSSSIHGEIDQWLWDLGSGFVSASQNMRILPSASGTYQIGQKVISNFGCMDSSYRNYEVYYKEAPAIIVEGNCENELISIKANPMFVDSVANVWWVIEGDTINSANVDYDFPNAGTFTVTQIIETNHACISMDNFSVKVDPAPQAVINYDQFCNDNQIAFSSGGGQLSWDLGDGTSSTQTNFVHQYPSLSTYQVQLIVTNNFGCEDTAKEDVKIDNIVVPDFTIKDVCEDEIQRVVNLTAGNGTPISKAEFDMDNGDIIQSLDSFEYAYNKSGTYNITLSVTTSAGCVYDTSHSLTVYPLPKADFYISPSDLDIFSSHIDVTDGSSLADSVVYTITDGTLYIGADFGHDFLDSGRFTIKQWVSTLFGCMDSLSKDVFIAYAYKLYIPNAFSPGDKNNLNDVFRPLGFGMASYEMWIYNRWGELIWQSQEPNQAWDGEGIMSGYYMYQIKVTDFENDVHNYSGGVYLLR